MPDYSKESILLYDLGLFVSLAELLAPHFKTVYYFCPGAEHQSPTTKMAAVGKGIPGVEKVQYWSDVIHQVQAVFFPDVTSGPVQEQIAEDYKLPVWGSRGGEDLELDRKSAKAGMKALGLNVGPYEVVRGVSNLRDFLKERKNVWVKPSRIRGDFESFFSKSYRLVENEIDRIQYALGPEKESVDFIVEDEIEDVVEIAFDGYSVDGKFPSSSVVGVEKKGVGYLGHFLTGKRIPEQLIEINEALAPTLEQHKYRNFFAVETFVTKTGEGYASDPCCRASSPCSELLQVMITNLPEILWEGAHGNIVEPVCAGKGGEEMWGAELIIHCSPAERDWVDVHYPKAIAENVKLRNMAAFGGQRYCVPQLIGSRSIGAVVATGKTRDEAIEKCCEYAQQIEGHCLDIDFECLKGIKADIDRLADYGVRL